MGQCLQRGMLPMTSPILVLTNDTKRKDSLTCPGIKWVCSNGSYQLVWYPVIHNTPNNSPFESYAWISYGSFNSWSHIGSTFTFNVLYLLKVYYVIYRFQLIFSRCHGCHEGCFWSVLATCETNPSDLPGTWTGTSSTQLIDSATKMLLWIGNPCRITGPYSWSHLIGVHLTEHESVGFALTTFFVKFNF